MLFTFFLSYNFCNGLFCACTNKHPPLKDWVIFQHPIFGNLPLATEVQTSIVKFPHTFILVEILIRSLFEGLHWFYRSHAPLYDSKIILATLLAACLSFNALGHREMAQELRSTFCFCRGHRFDRQHLHVSSQSSKTPFLGDLIFSSGLVRHQECTTRK